jgi:hypothetical protein
VLIGGKLGNEKFKILTRDAEWKFFRLKEIDDYNIGGFFTVVTYR